MDANPMLGHLDPGAAIGAEDVFRSAGARIRTQLVNRVGTDLELRPIGTDWVPLAQALGRTTQPSAWTTFRLTPSGLTGVVSVEARLLSWVVGKMLGQPETAMAAPFRPPSRFDLVVVKRLAEDVVGSIVGLFPQGTAETPHMVEVGSTARVSIGLPRTALVGATVYEVGPTEEPAGRITVIVPSEITRTIGPRMPHRPIEARVGMERVMVLPVTAVAELRRINLSLSDLRALKPGQMIELGPVRDVTVRVGDRAALVGEVGVQNHFRSIRVKSRVEGAFSR
jgi:flagellar motor switch protein FliM